MTSRFRPTGRAVLSSSCLALLLGWLATCTGLPSSCPAAEAGPAEGESPDTPTEHAYRTESMQGRVVWLAEAMLRRLGVKWTSTAAENILALETNDGQLYPLVEDVRGRSFRKDKRLREMQVELRVRRFENPALIQVVEIRELRDGKSYIVDYWCDICSIVMFESGPCDCCQQDNRLRKRPVSDGLLPCTRDPVSIELQLRD